MTQIDFSSNRLFTGLEADKLKSVTDLIPITEFETDDVVFREEDEGGESLYLIGDGRVKITIKGRGGAQETLSHFAPGDFFGEMALIDPAPRSASAVVTEKAALGRVDRETFDQILRIAPGTISRNLMSVVVSRLRNANQHFMQELLRSERLSLIGSMASGIIHDFKNPMATILFATELLAKRSGDPQSEKVAQTVSRSIDRMVNMTQELLDFSRGQTSQLQIQETAAEKLLEELEEQGFRPMTEEGIEVKKEISADGPLRIDPDRLSRALLNIIKNAREAMSGAGGSFTFRLSTAEKEILFELADTGPGMPEEVVAKLFEPFYTHGKKKGTGLGMAIALAAVEAHKGRIEVRSAPGEGTAFTIRLPAQSPVTAAP